MGNQMGMGMGMMTPVTQIPNSALKNTAPPPATGRIFKLKLILSLRMTQVINYAI